jgi:hypothetical protein
MKRIIILYVISLVFLGISGCERHTTKSLDDDINIPEQLDKEAPNKIIQNSGNSELDILSEQPIIYQDDDSELPDNVEQENPQKNTENNGNNTPDIAFEQPIIYKNERLGFELTFPGSWDGWYTINEIEDNAIEVAFYGKSKTSTLEFVEEYGKPGLHMFFIGNETFIEEPLFLDSIEKIGSIGADKYYYATSTDWPLGVLIDYDSKKLDETESALIKVDFEKAMQMTDEIEDLLRTFKAIE